MEDNKNNQKEIEQLWRSILTGEKPPVPMGEIRSFFSKFASGVFKIFLINCYYQVVLFLLYIIFIASWLYGFYRLTKQYKIKLFPNKYVKYLSYFMIIGWMVITLPSLKKKEINNERKK